MQTRLRGALSIVGREALRIVLPSWCVACENELPWRERTASCCAACWSTLPKIETAKCRSCALPLPAIAAQTPEDERPLCAACATAPLPLDWCDAWGHYRGALERLLQALKFKRHDFLDGALGGLLAETISARGDLAFDAIAAVPMARAKERRRGYNQAELLARALSLRSGIHCDMTLLTRRGERATQSTLPKAARAANVRGAFAASSRVKDTSILIVDDICTTGETLRACAAALRAAGASRVCAISVAKAS
ncbi:MAG TPA: phosphoribosyltransferase family protein [Thermoanaerobaculia bacterium]|nr:phosphoribosyltransferase family protein [Thermoanaerobaculia bacterium]